jgi:hypothetical protein
MTENLTAVGVENAVDGNGGGRGLQEVDGFLLRNVKALPVKREVLTALSDGSG